MSLEFHSREHGWLPAEPVPAGHPEVGGQLRAGTKHLAVQLPDGQVIYRRHVAHVAHPPLPNILAGGRCKHCGVTLVDGEHPDHIGRVYREAATAPVETVRETEPPATLPEPKTLTELKAAAPRTTRA